MDGRTRTAVVAGAAGLVIAIALMREEPRFAPLVQVALGAAGSAAFVATAVSWAGRYARTRDPHALFVAIALGVVAASGAIALWLGGRDLAVAARRDDVVATSPIVLTAPVGNDVAVATWLLGWSAAGVTAALAVPWRERRGRRPVRPGRGAIAAAAVVVVGDLLLALSLDRGSQAPAADGRADSVVIVLGLVAIVAWLVAGARALLHARGRTSHLLLGVGWIVAVIVPVAQIDRATYGLGLVRWIDASPLVVVALALAAALAAETAETSRMRRTTDRAEAVLGGRAEIASMLAHEVKGPVSTIKGLAATTSGSYAKLSDDERREFVGLIQDEAARLLDVVDQTSLALKIDAGTLAFDRRPIDLATVVQEAVSSEEHTGRDIRSTLADGITVVGDHRWLGVAIRQGVDNADRFSPADAPIDVTARDEGGVAVVEIADRGPGVPLERRDEVFTRFARWRPPGYEDRQGTGLGLFICRAVLAEHGGDASLEARPGGGTMLRLSIPLIGPPPMEG